MVVNVVLTIGIVRTIQNKVNNRRVLKDYLIKEVVEIRDDYNSFLKELFDGKVLSHDVAPFFKLMNIRANDIMAILTKKYKVNEKELKPFVYNLPNIITNAPEFNAGFRSNSAVACATNTRLRLINFQQSHNKIFNSIIIEINDK